MSGMCPIFINSKKKLPYLSPQAIGREVQGKGSVLLPFVAVTTWYLSEYRRVLCAQRLDDVLH